MKESKDYLKRHKHCELTVVVHYSVEAKHVIPYSHWWRESYVTIPVM